MADATRESTDGLDTLINNAGIMQKPQLQTEDGFELQFGTTSTADGGELRGDVGVGTSRPLGDQPAERRPERLLQGIYKVSNALMAQSAVDGAVPEVLAAAGSEARNGAYYGPTKFGDARGPVGESRISGAARDEDAGRRLWALSEELLGITFDVS